MKPEELKVQIFADGADLETIRNLARNPIIRGFTTNPTLMRKAGITDYAAFAKEAAAIVAPRSISLEVFADDLDEMEQQARVIAGWGANIFVKIPITNTKGESALPVVSRLARARVQVNVTAVMTKEQAEDAFCSVLFGTPSYVSVFAGRVADTGTNARDLMEDIIDMSFRPRTCSVIWASPREVWNVHEASELGCDIITVTPDILTKLPLGGKDLTEYSLDTVKMFHRDAQEAGYVIA